VSGTVRASGAVHPVGERLGSGETVVAIASSADIVMARQQGRALASTVGFTGSDLTVIATAISELARNILEYATSGRIVLNLTAKGERPGITICAHDEGPGIADITRALGVGYSTGQGLGLGLPGVRGLMDEFEIVSRAGEGTQVTVRKWLP
jgi:serine/threonine-protein kinase RsbT